MAKKMMKRKKRQKQNNNNHNNNMADGTMFEIMDESITKFFVEFRLSVPRLIDGRDPHAEFRVFHLFLVVRFRHAGG